MCVSGKISYPERVLAELDESRRVYICEFGIVHLKWKENNLVYCPGDFIGLPFLLSGLVKRCEQPCVHGEACPNQAEDGLVYLTYHSVKLPFSVEDCPELQTLVQTAIEQLQILLKSDYFAPREIGDMYLPV